jgi:hypothetical protein
MAPVAKTKSTKTRPGLSPSRGVRMRDVAVCVHVCCPSAGGIEVYLIFNHAVNFAPYVLIFLLLEVSVMFSHVVNFVPHFSHIFSYFLPQSPRYHLPPFCATQQMRLCHASMALSITSGSTHFPHPPGPPPPPPSGVSTFVTSIPRGLRWEIGPRPVRKSCNANPKNRFARTYIIRKSPNRNHPNEVQIHRFW